mmetsp:Transcript_110818/g.174717  ORF Transcript_110818/g.174717 Transcript_110818/m.174717 type:complete len:89 (-) Transcript_110818:203-469(-)
MFHSNRDAHYASWFIREEFNFRWRKAFHQVASAELACMVPTKSQDASMQPQSDDMAVCSNALSNSKLLGFSPSKVESPCAETVSVVSS